MQESSFLPCSNSIKRAVKITTDALVDLGYDVVPFVLDDESFRKPVDFMFGMSTNGISGGLLDDFEKECETMLKPLEATLMIMKASWLKRFFIDFVLTYIKNAGRSCRNLKALAYLKPVEFEKFLKKRYEYVYEMADKWQNEGLTAIVAPVWPHCGIKSKNNADMGLMIEYSIMWNITGFPSGVLPVTDVLATE